MNKKGTKKQRGSNYTPVEQTMLLDLIKKNIEIIENKETNAVVSSKKRTAWHEIAQQYNAMAVTGTRNWIQLRNLYENIKQRRRREIPKGRQQLYVKKINEQNKTTSSDTKEISCADDVYNASAMTETDKWIQAMVSPKIEPRRFSIELTISGDDMETITVPAQPPFILKHEIEKDSISAASSGNDFPDGDDDKDSKTVPAQPAFIKKHEIEEDRISAAGSSKEFPDDITKKKQPENGTCCKAKKEYFKLKLSNAKLERKFLLQRHKMEKEKLALQLEILNLKRQKLL